ncbi:diguanylate cyclase [Pseudoduganella sp. GCM10020061]|uniref:diguanylate cyclase n=1 Tax=Pseudoduganella sp. GCM10020061 TaxID=3317345 RepID=UPI003628F3FE
MADQLAPGMRPVGAFLSPSRERRQQFQQACGEHFSRLFMAPDLEAAETAIVKHAVDQLIMDLEFFDRPSELEALGRIVTLRRGAPVVAVVPYRQAGWIEALRAFGPVDYVIAPVANDALAAAVAKPPAVALSGAALRQLLAVRARMEQAVSTGGDGRQVSQNVCEALLAFPGVAHVSMFELRTDGELRVAAQAGEAGMSLQPILGRTTMLQQQPEGRAFPGVLSALTGEVTLLDVPEKSGDAELAGSLHAQAVRMVAAFPLPGADGSVRGSLCVMFNRERVLSHDDFATFASLSALAGVALRIAELERECAQLGSRMAHLEATDYLTGVPNRRSGEQLLDHEIRRAMRYQAPLAVAALDIDQFAALNERFGTACGDLALRTLADIVGGLLRGSDMLVRSGGDLFHVIAPHTNAKECLALAEKIRAAVAAFDFPGCDHVTLSIGIAALQPEESADQLMLRANGALARAKRAGRNLVELA